MHIKDLYLQDNFSVKEKMGTEIHGECPVCGGTKRFIIKMQGKGGQCPELGSFFCREGDCNMSGNAITYLMRVRDMSFPDACEFVGYDLPDSKKRVNNSGKKYFKAVSEDKCSGNNFFWYPAATVHDDFVKDPDLWAEHAKKFVLSCHEAIMTRPSALKWFADRGLGVDMIKKCRIGFFAGQQSKKKNKEYMPSYRMAASWGMPGLMYDDGRKQDRIVLPAGLVMPCYGSNLLVCRIQIRKMDNQKHIVKGSIGFSGAQWIFNPGQKVAIVCENERDGMVLSMMVPEVTVIPMGSSCGRPCNAAHVELRGKKLILLAFDTDKGGINAVDWWFQQYPHAQPWVLTGYKDPGEGIISKYDVAGWVRGGVRYYLENEICEVVKVSSGGGGSDIDKVFGRMLFLMHINGSAIEKSDGGRNLGIKLAGNNEVSREMYSLLHGDELDAYIRYLPDGVWGVGVLKKYFSS